MTLYHPAFGIPPFMESPIYKNPTKSTSNRGEIQFVRQALGESVGTNSSKLIAQSCHRNDPARKIQGPFQPQGSQAEKDTYEKRPYLEGCLPTIL